MKSIQIFNSVILPIPLTFRSFRADICLISLISLFGGCTGLHIGVLDDYKSSGAPTPFVALSFDVDDRFARQIRGRKAPLLGAQVIGVHQMSDPSERELWLLPRLAWGIKANSRGVGFDRGDPRDGTDAHWYIAPGIELSGEDVTFHGATCFEFLGELGLYGGGCAHWSAQGRVGVDLNLYAPFWLYFVDLGQIH